MLLTDNGSTDGSVAALQKIAQEAYWQSRLTLILNKENTGYAKANNQGLKLAKGQYWLLLNNDTVVHPDALQNLLDFAQGHLEAGVVGTKLLNINGSLQPSCFHFPTLSNAIRQYWFGRKGLLEKYAPLGQKPVPVDAVVGAVFLITPAAQKKIGLLDERYFAYFEDIDYCRQVWKKGLKVYYLPAAVITHYHGATFKKLADEKERWRKLIPSSKVYHGWLKHFLINAVIWLGKKWEKLLKTLK